MSWGLLGIPWGPADRVVLLSGAKPSTILCLELLCDNATVFPKVSVCCHNSSVPHPCASLARIMFDILTYFTL